MICSVFALHPLKRWGFGYRFFLLARSPRGCICRDRRHLNHIELMQMTSQINALPSSFSSVLMMILVHE